MVGVGLEKWKDSYYSGCFLNGQKNGIGIYVWKNKSKYEGEWKNDNMNGYGIYHFSDGRKYIGEWKDNYMNGFGIYLWKNNKKYMGYFKNGIKHGFGIFYLLNGKYVIGFWKDGKQNGFVKYINEDKIRCGIYNDGKRERWYDDEDIFLYDYMKTDNNKYRSFFEMDIFSLEKYLVTSELQYLEDIFFFEMLIRI